MEEGKHGCLETSTDSGQQRTILLTSKFSHRELNDPRGALPFVLLRFRIPIPARPIRPVPSSPSVPGSGTTVTETVATPPAKWFPSFIKLLKRTVPLVHGMEPQVLGTVLAAIEMVLPPEPDFFRIPLLRLLVNTTEPD